MIEQMMGELPPAQLPQISFMSRSLRCTPAFPPAHLMPKLTRTDFPEMQMRRQIGNPPSQADPGLPNNRR
jgi:hypothetical protein